jgi:2-octaprenyl-6-methoxyphenol hydroxylase
MHDILIVGGGLVGASLAIALEPLGLDVGMLEAAPEGALPPVFDQRNLSFAEATVHALHVLGVMPLLRASTGPIRRIHISRAGDFGRVQLDAARYQRHAFGEVVVARDFGEALEQRLQQLSQLTRYRPAQFVGFDAEGDGYRHVRIAEGGSERLLQARLVVAADGARSSVRSALGIQAHEHDYQQTLFVARLRAQHPVDGTAWERLTDTGPTALLPRGDGYYGMVHGVAREEANAVSALSDAAFLDRVQMAFGWRAGRLLDVGPRSAYPLTRCIATQLTASRAVLVGNAAQAIHPIGAQGFNLGLRDALTLAECIAADQDNIGSEAMLQHYAMRRMEDRQRTLAFSDGLARMTSQTSAWARPLRSLGLLGCEASDWLQARLAGGAMGYRGDVPEQCKGAA